MNVGIPTETKADEYRVALTPAGVRELVERGHGVVVQTGAGAGSAIADDAMRAEFATAAATLRELLGRRLVAYLDGVKETRAVNQWAAGEREPSSEVQSRLRLALQVALMIAEADGKRVAQAWFQGLNPQLDDRSPARALREGDPERDGQAVLGAARVFLGSG